MDRFWQALRTGAWITPDRVRVYSGMLACLAIAAMLGWIAMSNGLVDPNGKPIGTDFSSFYAAGSLVLDGHAPDAYNMAAHYARQQAIFGQAAPYYAWLYPPIFLLIAAPLALLPYAVALALWQGVTLLLYLGVIYWIVETVIVRHPAAKRLWWLVALTFPAVLVNLGHGQNGFLTAALLGAALMTLTHRPLTAGILFGLLSYKPQFALVIPLALLAAGQWRTLFAAITTVIALVGAAAFFFGADVWLAFARSTEAARKLLLENGDVGFEKLQSMFAAVRLWGGSISLAYAIQIMTSLLVAGSVAWIWRSTTSFTQKAALLVIATLLASPHTLDYDLVVLGIAIAFLARHGFEHGFEPFELTLMAVAWTVPLLTRSVASATGIPLGLIALLALYAVTLGPAARNLGFKGLLGRRLVEARSRS